VRQAGVYSKEMEAKIGNSKGWPTEWRLRAKSPGPFEIARKEGKKKKKKKLKNPDQEPGGADNRCMNKRSRENHLPSS